MPRITYDENEVYLTHEEVEETIIASDKAELVYNLLKKLGKSGIDTTFKDSNEIESTLNKFKNELHEFIK